MFSSFSQAKLKADKNRRKAGESLQKMVHSQRQEAAQQRREDKRRAEKERLLNEEDPEKARKLEVRQSCISVRPDVFGEGVAKRLRLANSVVLCCRLVKNFPALSDSTYSCSSVFADNPITR